MDPIMMTIDQEESNRIFSWKNCIPLEIARLFLKKDVIDVDVDDAVDESSPCVFSISQKVLHEISMKEVFVSSK